MASTATLEEKFHAAVKAIQRLPNDGTFQPSNEMKLTFYGLYKQATVGPCKESRPSILNYVNRAKWDAWDKYRLMSKEAAMAAYIDEIRKILETMPQTNEVLEFTQMIGPFYEFVDDRIESNGPTSLKKKLPTSIPSKSNLNEPLVNGNSDDRHHHTNGSTQVFVSSSNGPIPSSSPSSSSSSTISSSDVEEFYDDPSDRLPNNLDLPVEENVNLQTNSEPSTHVYGGQNGNNNPPTSRSHRHHHQHHHSSNHSPSRSSMRHHGSSSGARNSPSSMISGAGGSGRYPNNSYNKETQRAILTALTKLQHDVNNILERLNRLETSAHFLQQREIIARHHSSHSVFRWLPLAGLRRRAVAFILLWPFVVFALIRLFLRARIIIRFRKRRV